MELKEYVGDLKGELGKLYEYLSKAIDCLDLTQEYLNLVQKVRSPGSEEEMREAQNQLLQLILKCDFADLETRLREAKEEISHGKNGILLKVVDAFSLLPTMIILDREFLRNHVNPVRLDNKIVEALRCLVQVEKAYSHKDHDSKVSDLIVRAIRDYFDSLLKEKRVEIVDKVPFSKEVDSIFNASKDFFGYSSIEDLFYKADKAWRDYLDMLVCEGVLFLEKGAEKGMAEPKVALTQELSDSQRRFNDHVRYLLRNMVKEYSKVSYLQDTIKNVAPKKELSKEESKKATWVKYGLFLVELIPHFEVYKNVSLFQKVFPNIEKSLKNYKENFSHILADVASTYKSLPEIESEIVNTIKNLHTALMSKNEWSSLPYIR